MNLLNASLLLITIFPINSFSKEIPLQRKYDVCVEIANLRKKRQMQEYQACLKRAKIENEMVARIEKKLTKKEFELLGTRRVYHGCLSPENWDNGEIYYCQKQMQNSLMQITKEDMEKLK